jgi:hypothetical protein
MRSSHVTNKHLSKECLCCANRSITSKVFRNDGVPTRREDEEVRYHLWIVSVRWDHHNTMNTTPKKIDRQFTIGVKLANQNHLLPTRDHGSSNKIIISQKGIFWNRKKCPQEELEIIHMQPSSL